MERGGTERVVSILLDKLNDDFEFHLVLLDNSIAYPIPPEIKIRYLSQILSTRNNLVNILSIPFLALLYAKFCNKNNIETSLSFLNRPNFISTLAKVFGLKANVIISERSYPALQYEKGFGAWIGRSLIKVLYKKADLITANSKRTALDLKQTFGLVKTPSVVIYNPIDVISMQSEKENPVTLPKLKGFSFVHVGNFNPVKNHKLLIEAFSNLNFEDCRLILVGEGRLEQEIKALANKLKIQEKVIFAGRLNNPAATMAKADCLILTSDIEGFPNVLLEALACGLPIIATDCLSGPREILAPQSDFTYQLKDDLELAEHGILTPVNNINLLVKAMKIMYADKEMRVKYASKATERAEEFDTTKIIKQFASILSNTQ